MSLDQHLFQSVARAWFQVRAFPHSLWRIAITANSRWSRCHASAAEPLIQARAFFVPLVVMNSLINGPFTTASWDPMAVPSSPGCPFRMGQWVATLIVFIKMVTTIGRTNGNDLIIQGRTVSRRHARLYFDSGRWYLEDLQSANGTLVNNVRVYQPVVLNDGDVINFGDEIVVFNTTY